MDQGFLTENLSTVESIESLRAIVSPTKARKSSGDIRETNRKPETGNRMSDGKEHCEFCPDGFKTSEYYEHFALGHLREMFERDIERDMPELK